MTTNLLVEIEDWKLEAKLEASNRYFFHTAAVEKITEGKRCFVIGRKGTGKTAISEYLSHIDERDCQALKMTFKNFPFNVLYSQSDALYTPPNQYISVWKFLIYSSICKMLARSPEVDPEVRQQLSELFAQDIEHALPNAVTEWTGFEFDVKLLGSGIGGGRDRAPKQKQELTISEKADILETFIRRHVGKSTYLVLFDELDEDYKNMLKEKSFERYTELLTSLFKAVQDVRSRFQGSRIYPIIFLRDDIYDILQDPDKTKWSDYRVNLDWSRETLQSMLAFRISRAIDNTGRILPFSDAWSRVFARGGVKYGHEQQREMSIFDYISRSTHNRPRDYIRYMQVCAEKALEKRQTVITPDIVRTQDKAFSNYLRSELEDEIHGVLPEIGHIISIFTKIRKQQLKVEEFARQYQREVSAGTIPERDIEFVLTILFMFSVIGNVPRQKNQMVFKYQNPEARFNPAESICPHRGLFKALQIL